MGQFSFNRHKPAVRQLAQEHGQTVKDVVDKEARQAANA